LMPWGGDGPSGTPVPTEEDAFIGGTLMGSFSVAGKVATGNYRTGWDGREAVVEATGPSITVDGKKYQLLGYDAKGSPVYEDARKVQEQEAETSTKLGNNTPDSAEQNVDWVGQRHIDGKKPEIITDVPEKDWDFSNLTPEKASQEIKKAVVDLQKLAEKMDYPYGLVFGHQANSAKVQVAKDFKLPFGYNHKEDIVYVNPYHDNFIDYDFHEAILHEFAHRYDRTAVGSWKSQGFCGALTKAKAYAINNLGILEQIVNQYPTDYYLQDIISIVADGRAKVFAGHGQLKADSEAKEVFANLASMRARNMETYDVLRRIFPDMIKEFEVLFGGE